MDFIMIETGWLSILPPLIAIALALITKEVYSSLPKLLDAIKATPEYNSAAWLLKYQIESMLDIYKRLM